MTSKGNSPMTDAFKALLDTKELWLPSLIWLLGQLSATGTGMKIERSVKKHLKDRPLLIWKP